MTGMNFPGSDKLMSRFFRKAEGVVWDLLSGRIGVVTKEGIATLEGTGDDAQVNINLMDQFGMEVPAFAQNTPVEHVKAGDIIYFGASDKPGWVIEVKADNKGLVLMKADGQRSTWKPPKITMFGIDGGVMVLRSLLTMLPGGAGGLGAMQGALLPMMMMGGDSGMDMEKMMPLMLMSQMGTGLGGATPPDGAAPNAMAQMMPMLMMMQMMKGGDSPFSSGGTKKLNAPGFARG